LRYEEYVLVDCLYIENHVNLLAFSEKGFTNALSEVFSILSTLEIQYIDLHKGKISIPYFFGEVQYIQIDISYTNESIEQIMNNFDLDIRKTYLDNNGINYTPEFKRCLSTKQILCKNNKLDCGCVEKYVRNKYKFKLDFWKNNLQYISKNKLLQDNEEFPEVKVKDLLIPCFASGQVEYIYIEENFNAHITIIKEKFVNESCTVIFQTEKDKDTYNDLISYFKKVIVCFPVKKIDRTV
jgi:hypothetical protein